MNFLQICKDTSVSFDLRRRKILQFVSEFSSRIKNLGNWRTTEIYLVCYTAMSQKKQTSQRRSDASKFHSFTLMEVNSFFPSASVTSQKRLSLITKEWNHLLYWASQSENSDTNIAFPSSNFSSPKYHSNRHPPIKRQSRFNSIIHHEPCHGYDMDYKQNTLIAFFKDKWNRSITWFDFK